MTEEESGPAASTVCRDTTYWVSEARDGELGDAERRALEAHLATCDRCTAAKRQFSRMFDALDALLARDKDAP